MTTKRAFKLRRRQIHQSPVIPAWAADGILFRQEQHRLATEYAETITGPTLELELQASHPYRPSLHRAEREAEARSRRADIFSQLVASLPDYDGPLPESVSIEFEDGSRFVIPNPSSDEVPEYVVPAG